VGVDVSTTGESTTDRVAARLGDMRRDLAAEEET
jgi:hypothetical protein